VLRCDHPGRHGADMGQEVDSMRIRDLHPAVRMALLREAERREMDVFSLLEHILGGGR